LSTLCETLKLFHAGGALPGRKVLVMGASGGDMAMTADVARFLDLDFAAIPATQAASLRAQLTDRVTVANPFDIHTYLWFDPPALGRVFATALRSGYDAVGFMLDRPPEGEADASAYDVVIDEFIAASQTAPSRAALIASLPETISASIRQRCLAGGVIPLQGQREALEALSLAGGVGLAWRSGPGVRLHIPPPADGNLGTHAPRSNSATHGKSAAGGDDSVRTLSEAEGKSALAAFGVRIPQGRVVSPDAVARAAAGLGFPVAIKAVGAHLEHKTEVGGVVLNVRGAAEAAAAAGALASLSDTLLVEEMITDGVAEMLVGVVVDPQFGQVLVVGAGGVLTELLSDSVTLLPPWTQESITAALGRLTAAKLLQGFRGKPAGDVDALVEAILGVGRYASASLATLVEIDVNPVIVRPAGKGVVAVDTLIRLKNLAR
jgi:acetyl-CoA synthetase